MDNYLKEKINPRVDFAFKKLFGTEENKDLLISMINAIVSDADQVSDLVLKNPYNPKSFSSDKLSILDIKAKDSKGRWYNIEMQITDQEYFDKRALYYWSRLYTSQLSEGINYDKLAKTISINILNFNCLHESSFHNIYQLLNINTHKLLLDQLEMHFIELEKYDRDISQVKTALDRWITFLTRAQRLDKRRLPKELSKDLTIQRAMKILDDMSMTEEERDVYEGQLKWMRDEELALKSAHKKGFQAGIEKGIEKMARKMKKTGIPVIEIATITGLDKAVIEAL